MNDNLRRYRASKCALVQLYQSEPTGRVLQSLHVMAMFINGIVASKSMHTREVAKKTPTGAKVTSREKQLGCWYQNERVSYELHMLPFVRALLAGLASQTLVLAIDGSEVGRNYVTLIDGQPDLPKAGHTPAVDGQDRKQRTFPGGHPHRVTDRSTETPAG